MDATLLFWVRAAYPGSVVASKLNICCIQISRRQFKVPVVPVFPNAAAFSWVPPREHGYHSTSPQPSYVVPCLGDLSLRFALLAWLGSFLFLHVSA